MLDQPLPSTPSTAPTRLSRREPERRQPALVTLTVSMLRHGASCSPCSSCADRLRGERPGPDAGRARRGQRQAAHLDLGRGDLRVDGRAAPDHGLGDRRPGLPVDAAARAAGLGCRRGRWCSRARCCSRSEETREQIDKANTAADGVLAGERERRGPDRARLRGPRHARRRRHGRGLERRGRGRGGRHHRRAERHAACRTTRRCSTSSTRSSRGRRSR